MTNNKLKVYISGKMSGVYNYNKSLFNEVEDYLRVRELPPNTKIYNPASFPQQESYTDYIRFCIKQLLKCNSIYLVEGWENSRGSLLESRIALICGLDHYVVNRSKEFGFTSRRINFTNRKLNMQ